MRNRNCRRIGQRFSLGRFFAGPLLILIGASNGNIAFGTSLIGTAAASALVFYMLLIPYLLVLTFFIEGQSGVPPGYRFFQFFIARSGHRHIDRALGESGSTFNTTGFRRRVEEPRVDRYQSKMEAEELRAAAQRARNDFSSCFLVACARVHLGSRAKNVDLVSLCKSRSILLQLSIKSRSFNAKLLRCFGFVAARIFEHRQNVVFFELGE